MNVSVTPELAKWIEQKVDSGKYGSASEVVRAALRSLMENEEVHEAKVAWLRAEIQKGLDDLEAGRVKEWNDESYEDVKRRGREMLKKRRSA